MADTRIIKKADIIEEINYYADMAKRSDRYWELLSEAIQRANAMGIKVAEVSGRWFKVEEQNLSEAEAEIKHECLTYLRELQRLADYYGVQEDDEESMRLREEAEEYKAWVKETYGWIF